MQERDAYLSSLEQSQTWGSNDAYQKMMLLSIERSLDIIIAAVQWEHIKSSEQLFKIGEVAKRSGEQVSTIRYWTSLWLLEISEKTKGGMTLYDISVLERIEYIKWLKQQRYTLQEIRERL